MDLEPIVIIKIAAAIVMFWCPRCAKMVKAWLFERKDEGKEDYQCQECFVIQTKRIK